MPQIQISINDRSYSLGCNEGEEVRLRQLAARLDEKVRQLAQTVGQVGEARLLLMAGLLLADETLLAEAAREEEKTKPSLSEQDLAHMDDHARWLGEIARKIDDIAARLIHP